MIEVLLKLTGWLMSLWSSIPDSLKEKIIMLIVESFDYMLRVFFRENQSWQRA